MSILIWVVLGLVAGFVSSRYINTSGHGLTLDVLLGVAGALIGGFGFNFVTSAGIMAFEIWSMFSAVVVAVLAVGVFHLITAGRESYA